MSDLVCLPPSFDALPASPKFERLIHSSQREGWLDLRKTMVTASEIAVVLGISPYMSALELYAQKRGLLPSQEETEAMEIGLALEEIICKLIAKQRGLGEIVAMDGWLCRSTVYPWMGATPDAWLFDPHEKEPPKLLQAKNTSQGNAWGVGKDEQVPVHIQLQEQGETLVLDRPYAIVGALIEGRTRRWAKIEAVAEVQQNIVVACKNFIECVQAGEPPEPNGSESAKRALMHLYPEIAQPPTFVDVDATFEGYWDELETIPDRIKALEDRKELLKQYVIDAAGENVGLILPSGRAFRAPITNVAASIDTCECGKQKQTRSGSTYRKVYNLKEVPRPKGQKRKT